LIELVLEDVPFVELSPLCPSANEIVARLVETSKRVGTLVLAGTGLTDNFLLALKSLSLTHLYLDNCRHITDDAVRRFLRNNEGLKTISLTNCALVSDGLREELMSHSRLEIGRSRHRKLDARFRGSENGAQPDHI